MSSKAKNKTLTRLARRYLYFQLNKVGIKAINGVKLSSCSNRTLSDKYSDVIDPEFVYNKKGFIKLAHNTIPVRHKKKFVCGYVYLITDERCNVCKIGFSKNPESRLKEIQTSYPFKLKLECYVAGTIEDEGKLHRTFKSYRLMGEWFEYNHEIKKVFSDLLFRRDYINDSAIALKDGKNEGLAKPSSETKEEPHARESVKA